VIKIQKEFNIYMGSSFFRSKKSEVGSDRRQPRIEGRGQKSLEGSGGKFGKTLFCLFFSIA